MLLAVQYRLPLAPLANSIEAVDAVWPTQIVATSDLISCIVSYIANPAFISPPGEIMYIEISSCLFSASNRSSSPHVAAAVCAVISSDIIIILLCRSFLLTKHNSAKCLGTQSLTFLTTTLLFRERFWRRLQGLMVLNVESYT